MQMSTPTVAAKVWASAITALIVPIILGIVKTAYPAIPLPINANDLLGTVLQGAILGVMTFAAGYLRSPHPQDQIVPAPRPTPVQYAPAAPPVPANAPAPLQPYVAPAPAATAPAPAPTPSAPAQAVEQPVAAAVVSVGVTPVPLTEQPPPH